MDHEQDCSFNTAVGTFKPSMESEPAFICLDQGAFDAKKSLEPTWPRKGYLAAL